jgi:replicative DNA helicase
MIEFSILKKFLNSSEDYIRYSKYINVSYIKENYKDVYRVLKTIEDYYKKYHQEPSIDIESLEAHYLSIYPLMKEADRKILSGLLHSIYEAPINESITAYLENHRNRSIAGELALACFDAAEGKAPFELLHSIYSKFSTDNTLVEDIYITDDLEKLYDTQSHTPGLRWRLNFLNRSLGSLRQGDFGFIFARPETGKTTFLASEVTNFAPQTERPILWCNNEEGGNKVKLRCYQATLGLTSKDLFKDLKGNKEKYNKIIGGKIKIYDDAGMTMASIEARCKELNPALIIIDQIDKVKGYKNERYDLQMKELYQAARELAKKYGPVIAVCQAGGTGEGKKYLTMNDVDSSHTAKQGEADFILGIGASNEVGFGNVRFLNISKNKLLGDDDTETDLRHGNAEVLMEPGIARYKDV